MTRPVRNIDIIRKSKRDHKNISIIILSTTTERECEYNNKTYIPTEIIKLQIQTIYETFKGADIFVITKSLLPTLLPLKNQYTNLRILYQPNNNNENELSDLNLVFAANTNKHIIIISGAMLFSNNVIKNILQDNSRILIDKNDPQLPNTGIGVTLNNNRVVHMSYDLNPKWGKILYLNPKDYYKFQMLCQSNDIHHKLLFEGINKFINNGGQILTFSPKKYFLSKVNNRNDIKRYVNLKLEL